MRKIVDGFDKVMTSKCRKNLTIASLKALQFSKYMRVAKSSDFFFAPNCILVRTG